MAHPKHEAVRRRYRFECGYCRVSEVEAGGELKVDHYRPVSAGGDDSENNLVYACIRCNLYKGDFLASAQQLALGRRVLQPLLDDMTAHLRLDEMSGRIEPLTDTGRFHAELLQLNRPALVLHRRRKWLVELSEEVGRSLTDENERLRSTLEAQARYIRYLEGLRDS